LDPEHVPLLSSTPFEADADDRSDSPAVIALDLEHSTAGRNLRAVAGDQYAVRVCDDRLGLSQDSLDGVFGRGVPIFVDELKDRFNGALESVSIRPTGERFSRLVDEGDLAG
jgi:hypothetical protein